VSPIRNAEGKIVGASKIARDITEQRRSAAQIALLAQEAEHRAKNVLAAVQATVQLSQSETSDGLKQAIQRRIQALANVHGLFVQSRWSGADLNSLVAQELSPYCEGRESRARINGPNLVLEPNAAQAIAVSLHELTINAAKYWRSVGAERLRSNRMVVYDRWTARFTLGRDRRSACHAALPTRFRHASDRPHDPGSTEWPKSCLIGVRKASPAKSPCRGENHPNCAIAG
jgi:hypothetical protein